MLVSSNGSTASTPAQGFFFLPALFSTLHTWDTPSRHKSMWCWTHNGCPVLIDEGRKEGRNAHVWRIEAVLLQRGNPWAGITSIFQMQYLRAPLWRQPHPHYSLFSLCGTLGWRHISYPGLSDSKIEVVLYYIILPPQRKMGGERTILFHF